MNAGMLTNKIKLKATTLASDGAGGFLPNGAETTVLETVARIKPIKATRLAENLQEGINSTYQVNIYQRDGFKPKATHTLEWKGINFEIVTIEETLEVPREWVLIIVDRGEAI